SQGIIAIGGKENESADMLLQFGEQKRKNIFPFSFMGGAAMRSFYRKQYALKDRFGNKYSLLQDEIHFCDILNELEESIKSTIDSKEKLRFFISYSRKHPYEADYIETILRRLGLEVFRDESDFGAGDEIPDQITEALYASNVFIAVYCADYACSPWCYDELELALDLHAKKKMKLWLLCVDETRVVSKRARKLIHYRLKTREEIEGKLLWLLNEHVAISTST
ncbi:MAG: toll/interleukin-1 receptor domain-containing protein, partial [Proteocatella sp.]